MAGPAKLNDGAADEPHVVEHDDFLIVPINSSNWRGTMTTIRGGWSEADWQAVA